MLEATYYSIDVGVPHVYAQHDTQFDHNEPPVAS
jgi:hypothetical protein